MMEVGMEVEERACAQSKGLKVRISPVGNEGKEDNEVENTKKKAISIMSWINP